MGLISKCPEKHNTPRFHSQDYLASRVLLTGGLRLWNDRVRIPTAELILDSRCVRNPVDTSNQDFTNDRDGPAAGIERLDYLIWGLGQLPFGRQISRCKLN